MMRIAKKRKQVSDTASPDKIEENEFRSFKRTRRESKVPRIPKIDIVVNAIPSM